MRFRIAFAFLEGAGRFGGQPSSLHHGEYFQLDQLSNALKVVNCRFLQSAVLQPAARIRVPLMHQDQWMQSSLLAARAKKKRQIEARSEPVLDDVRRKAHFLSRGLEAGRRRHIADAHLSNGFVDRSHLLPGPLPALVLVTIKRRSLGMLAEN